MSWQNQEIEDEIKKGLLRFYIGIGRVVNDKAISQRAEYTAKYFEDYQPEKIGLFFEWMADTFDKFIVDRDLKALALQKKEYSFTDNGKGSYFYAVSGAKVRQGTFVTLGTVTTSEWHLLPTRVKELSVKARNDLLIGPELQEWREMQDQRYSVKRGKIQKPREEWVESDEKIYGEYLDFYVRDVEEWENYENSLIEASKEQSQTKG